MSSIYMMIGIQGSGKTTYSKELSAKLNIPIISSDGIRNEFPFLDEKMVFPTCYKRGYEIIKGNGSFIYDATNITKSARKHFIEELGALGVDFKNVELIAYYFIPNLELSKKRVEERNKIKGERFLPLDVIDDYMKRIEEADYSEGFNKIIRIES